MVQANEVEVTPFVLEDFTTSDSVSVVFEPVSKKELKSLANELGLAYDDATVAFAKKLINSYIKKR